MKNFKVLMATMYIVLGALSLQAQLKINQNGKLLLGDPYATQDPNNVLSGSVFGPHGACRSGSKLAFGDFGRQENGGFNVFTGEYLLTDTDQLWLHGKSGIYLTRGGSTITIVASYVPNSITFYEDITAPSVIKSSDERFKSNVQSIENPLQQLLSLNGVKYDYNDKERLDKYTIKPEKEPDYSDITEKELESLKQDEEYEKQRSEKIPQMGLIAQEVREIFPDIVREDELGYLGIDYLCLIPVIIEAMREQQNIIDLQNSKIDELEEKLNEIGKSASQSGGSNIKSTSIDEYKTFDIKEKAFLFQNAPNPFNENTEIKYFLPKENVSAELNIYDMQGRNVISKKLQNQGEGSLIIEGAKLSPGTYIYILYSNGKEIDSKRMILTK
ncbi:MAG: tail fiber domain-containing protein [Bacteroidales bacterium]|jgi:hypothetical protein|nr:tail fiber domain-containing protein [Bacteroidales bacterium]